MKRNVKQQWAELSSVRMKEWTNQHEANECKPYEITFPEKEENYMKQMSDENMEPLLQKVKQKHETHATRHTNSFRMEVTYFAANVGQK